MGIFTKKWCEVYTTMEEDKFYRFKNILAENKIDTKTELVSDNMRLAMSGRSRCGIGNNRTVYKLKVRLKDKEKAICLMQKH